MKLDEGRLKMVAFSEDIDYPLIAIPGTANRIFFEDRGVEVVEFFKSRDGEMLQRKYTAWFDQPVDFEVGAKGLFYGRLVVKVERWVKDGKPVLNKQGEQGVSAVVTISNATFQRETPTTLNKITIPDEEMPF